MIEHWYVKEVRCDYIPWALKRGFPAVYLGDRAQWLRGRGPTGGEYRVFVGPTFHGSEIEIRLEADQEAAGGLAITARFEHGPPEAPEVVLAGTLAHGTGTYRLSLDPPIASRVTLCLTHLEPDDIARKSVPFEPSESIPLDSAYGKPPSC